MYLEAGIPVPPPSAGTALPPGKYQYSPALPHLMNVFAPSYWFAVEPVFMDHLLLHADRRIRLETTAGPLVGVLAGVAPDHVRLDVEGVPHHVRLSQIVYFSKA